MHFGHFGSLAVEEQFYLLWPAAVFALSRRGLIRLCIACIVGSAFLRVGVLLMSDHTNAAIAVYVLAPTKADALASGALVAVIGRHPEGMRLLLQGAKPIATICSLILATLFVWRGGWAAEDPVVQMLAYSPVAFLFASILVLAITSNRRLAHWLSHPTLRLCRKYSYSLYVFHMPVIILLEARVFSASDGPELLGTRLFGQVMFVLLAGAVSMCLAVASWHLLETRFLELKRLFPYGGSTSDEVLQRQDKAVSIQRVDLTT